MTTCRRGFARFKFEMHAHSENRIALELNHPSIPLIVLDKVDTQNRCDPFWQATVMLADISSIDDLQAHALAAITMVLDFMAVELSIAIRRISILDVSLTSEGVEEAIGHVRIPALQAHGFGTTQLPTIASPQVDYLRELLNKPDLQHRTPEARLFREALSAEEPLVQFMVLYLILEIRFQRQREIDAFILRSDPSTATTPDPRQGREGRVETIYTRLRNEMAHRENFNIDATTVQIRNCLDRLRLIVREAVKESFAQTRLGRR
jgi:hypothetical protein